MALSFLGDAWAEDALVPRVDRMIRGASPHQREFRAEHPERFRVGDIVRVGADRLVGTGKFFYGIEFMRALNEVVCVEAIDDAGVLGVRRAVGGNAAQRVRRGDVLSIIGEEQKP